MCRNDELLLNIRDVTVFRGKNRVLNQLSFALKRGEHTVILGPNGAGKSTLLRLITRDLYAAYAPECTFELFGKKTWNLFELRKKLGIVSDELQEDIPGRMTVRDVLYSGFCGVYDPRAFGTFTPEQDQAVARMLELLDIEKVKSVRMDRLSSGQRRRALLGRACMNDPELLVLDEPTTSLDPGAAYAYMQLITQGIARRATLLLVTHRLHEILPDVRRIAILKNGTIAEEGTPQKMLTSARLSDLFNVDVRVQCRNGYYGLIYGGEA